MKRRGTTTTASNEPETRSNVVAADVDDRLSSTARQRMVDKAAAEAAGRKGSTTPVQKLPVGFIVIACCLLMLMLYLTLRFS